ncbi:MAG TPA: DUF1289 domain-containing protein [Accumulibacter sp.]|nr:hypothetical protein [Accumulibacter sp.]HMW18965.1 DUF1289 domain-containing protein [Accumulibacter sp.]HMX22064.1 DUF1289 domain-containing protein [Accumulibacter sp.]HMY06989.1 DUF1289 domain-containing protein [Accumulibacter sp.]HNC18560.1 DUF1289 domain-containing protein [Accumulibacter sp.]
MSETDDDYLCVGICMADPDSGYCLGCGRPPEPASPGDQGIVVEVIRRQAVSDRSPNDDAPSHD